MEKPDGYTTNIKLLAPLKTPWVLHIDRVESVKYSTSFTPLVQASNKTGLHVLRVIRWRSELVMAHWLLAGLDENTLHGAPPVVLVGRFHAMHFTLAPDWVSILLPGHAQINVGAHMFETHVLISFPEVAITLHCPNIQVIPFTILSKSADLLQTTRWRKKTRFVQWC